MNAAQTDAAPAFTRLGVNVASAGLGAEGLSATDEFFAPLARMLDDAPATFHPDRYDDNGKWMDGWESRRKRVAGHDHAVIRLAARARILGFDVDTSHFTGNYPPACRIEACDSATPPDDATVWREVLPVSALGPSAHHYFASSGEQPVTHVRLSIFPDGGVARLRVYGAPVVSAAPGEMIDLASSLSGARILGFSDAHYGRFNRLLAPGRGENMGDGWETRRRREPGNDWIVIALGARGAIERVVVDTAFYKGNFPDSCSIQAADLTGFAGDLAQPVITAAMFWETLLPPQKLRADHVHEFPADALTRLGPVTHVRLNIFPDGGVSRLKLHGRLA
jgi:allantoicase